MRGNTILRFAGGECGISVSIGQINDRRSHIHQQAPTSVSVMWFLRSYGTISLETRKTRSGKSPTPPSTAFSRRNAMMTFRRLSGIAPAILTKDADDPRLSVFLKGISGRESRSVKLPTLAHGTVH